jgi:acyl-coenzyme A synthetase/AMP-(fatty) acid ligase
LPADRRITQLRIYQVLPKSRTDNASVPRIGHPDQSDLIKPRAFVVLQVGYSPSEQLAGELVDHCSREMAAFKRPRWIEFVDELPRTATGKLQRSKLR